MNKFILIVSILINLYLSAFIHFDQKCRKFYGWELYSLYPEPICHVMENKETLSYLEHMKYYKPIPFSDI